jgi:ABC-2 type transport system ATP-binding protein
VLTRAATAVAVTGPDALMISGLPAERVVALMTANSIPFAEVTAHRATLEEAYLELTRDAVEYRAESAGQAAR